MSESKPSEVRRARNALGLSLREAFDAVTRHGSADAAIAALQKPEQVSNFIGQYDRMAEEIRQLKAQRDELAQALSDLMELERRGRLMPIGREWDMARAAIAKAEGC